MITRRQLLQTLGYGSIGLFLPASLSLLPSPARAFRTPNRDFSPDLDVELAAKPGQSQIFSGRPTDVWRFHGNILSGDKNSLQILDDSYLGPIFRVKKGQKIRIRFKNLLPEASIIHWHGLKIPDVMDGHPRFVIPRGETYVYEFKVINRAGTYWYHPHPHGRTGPQVYGGLAGLFLVSDNQEHSLGLPQGTYDIPIVIQDRRFDNTNQLVYLQHRMDQMQGFLGDTILVNGKPSCTLSAAACPHRLRILNGSNSRIYRLAWDDETPLTVIGTDGGLLESPWQTPSVMVGPGERVDLWMDFSKYPPGKGPSLISLPFTAGRRGRGMMGRGFPAMPNGQSFPICSIAINTKETRSFSLPEKLSSIKPLSGKDTVNSARPKQFYLTMQHMQWTINGRTFHMTDVAPEERVDLGRTEVWEFINRGGMHMMSMMQLPHPMHLHGVQFQILERRSSFSYPFVDQGWKDTFLVMPGDRVKIAVPFDSYPGLYLYHCHNLEHEDMGMMRNYRVAG